jgi:hypothetical protein
MPYCYSNRCKRFWREPARYRHKFTRNPEYNKKSGDFIKVNDKLKMLAILFIAGFRSIEEKGVSNKHLRIYLYEEPECHAYSDEKNYDRVYINVDMNITQLKRDGRIITGKIRKRGKRKPQIVKV